MKEEIKKPEASVEILYKNNGNLLRQLEGFYRKMSKKLKKLLKIKTSIILIISLK